MRNNKNCFTLIELMVVIAIIVILASILLPTLRRARSVAQSILCKTNIKTINTALQLYCTDNGGTCCPTYHIVAVPSDDVGWLTLITRSGYLKEHFLEEGGRCPTNPIHAATEGDVDHINYMRCVSFGHDMWEGGHHPVKHETVKMASIRFPSKTPEVADSTFYDGDNDVNKPCNWEYDSFMELRDEGIVFPHWHLGEYNLSFADMHIQQISLTDNSYLDWVYELHWIEQKVRYSDMPKKH